MHLLLLLLFLLLLFPLQVVFLCNDIGSGVDFSSLNCVGMGGLRRRSEKSEGGGGLSLKLLREAKLGEAWIQLSYNFRLL